MQNTPDHWLPALPQPKADGHKYDRGLALIYGATSMTGAARLAARAAQRIGAGVVIVAASSQALPIYATALESVIVRACDTSADWAALLQSQRHDAVLIGPGLDVSAEHQALVLAALAPQTACVLDAGALTNFAAVPEQLLSKLHPLCVLTPHEGEFQRIFGARIEKTQTRTQRALQAAKLANCVVLLKGAETVIATPDGRFSVNTNAPPWLATAGAGDVLSGFILGLLAQKMPPFPAAAAAAWLHGDIATSFGLGLIAEDLVAGLPAALQRLSQDPLRGLVPERQR